MKPKVLLLSFFTALTLLAKAHTTDVNDVKNNPTRKNDINGYVIHSETKKPLSNVSITAYTNTRKEKVITTDGSGNYAFDDLKPGVYRLVFEKDGYKKVTKEKVVIRTDEAFQLNVEMAESEGFDFIPGIVRFGDF